MTEAMNIYIKSLCSVLSGLAVGESIPLSKLTNNIDRSLNISKVLNELDTLTRKGYIQIDIQSNVSLTEEGHKYLNLIKLNF